jgi:hypothetical protein
MAINGIARRAWRGLACVAGLVALGVVSSQSLSPDAPLTDAEMASVLGGEPCPGCELEELATEACNLDFLCEECKSTQWPSQPSCPSTAKQYLGDNIYAFVASPPANDLKEVTTQEYCWREWNCKPTPEPLQNHWCRFNECVPAGLQKHLCVVCEGGQNMTGNDPEPSDYNRCETCNAD